MIDINTTGNELIYELMLNTYEFNRQSKSIDLLQHYTHGFPIKTLIPLINSVDIEIQEQAFWILSQLGDHNIGIELLPDVLAILKNKPDFWIEHHSIEIIFIWLQKNNIENFSFIIQGFLSDHPSIRTHTMNLVSYISEAKLEAVLWSPDRIILDQFHKIGLTSLLGVEGMCESEIAEMLNSKNATIRKYGIIIASKKTSEYGDLIKEATNHIDADVCKYATLVVEKGRLGFWEKRFGR
jgi:hypothetical protein